MMEIKNSTIARPLRYIIPIIVLLVMIIAAYSNTFSSPPVLDDFHTFVDEPLVKLHSFSIQSILDLTNTKFSYFRWIPMITFALDLSSGKGNLSYLHCTNIIIHCVCFLVSMLFLCQIIAADHHRSHKQPTIVGPLGTALMVSSLWALNPVQTNAVTYLVQRMTSLSSLFFLLSMSFYVMGRRHALEKKVNWPVPWLLYGSSALVAVLAFLCKENSAMIPVAMFLTEWWFFQPDLVQRAMRLSNRHKIMTGVLAALGFAISYNIVLGLLGGFGGRSFTVWQRLMTEARIVVWYISVLLWPDPGRLSLEHYVVLSTSLVHPFSTVLSIGFLGGLSYWVVRYRQKYALVTYGLMWFLLNLVIESSIVPLELLFEHRMYLPSLGLFLALIAGVQHLISRMFGSMKTQDTVTVTWCVIALICSGLCLATYSRNETWSDSVTLNADNVAKAPESPRAHSNYAVALSRVDRSAEAIDQARSAISLGRKNYEEYGVSVNTILISYHKLGQDERILKEAKGFIDGWPAQADVYTMPSIFLQLANAQLELGHIEDSYQTTQKALLYNLRMNMPIPEFEEVCSDRLQRLFKTAKAQDVSLPGMDLAESRGVGARYWCALQLMQSGYLLAGERLLRELATIDAAHAEASREILNQTQDYGQKNLVQAGKWSFSERYVRHPISRFNASMAIAYLVREYRLPSPFRKWGESCLDYALNLQPLSSDAHLLKGWYYFERGQVQEAEAEANQAIEIDPECAKAWMGLGFFIAKGPNPEQAVSAFTKALELYPGYPKRSTITTIINSLKNPA